MDYINSRIKTILRQMNNNTHLNYLALNQNILGKVLM